MGKEVNDRKCTDNFRQVCNPVPKTVCNDVSSPREVCNEVPEEICNSVPVPVTRYEDDEQCSTVSVRKCAPATRQQCSEVEEQVPKQECRNVPQAALSSWRSAATVEPGDREDT